MTDTRDLPQIYLVTPPALDLDVFPDLLAACLDAAPVGCLRLSLATRDADKISRTADALREVAHARDVAIVIESHALLVEKLGLDGVHLTDGSRSVRQMRKDLGGDAIIGTHCAGSRHDGMTAAEAGADYVAFGPMGATSLGDGKTADQGLFEWWSAMIEVPVVAEGNLTYDLIRTLTPYTDFFAFRDEVWDSGDPVTAFRALAATIG